MACCPLPHLLPQLEGNPCTTGHTGPRQLCYSLRVGALPLLLLTHLPAFLRQIQLPTINVGWIQLQGSLSAGQCLTKLFINNVHRKFKEINIAVEIQKI